MKGLCNRSNMILTTTQVRLLQMHVTCLPQLVIHNDKQAELDWSEFYQTDNELSTQDYRTEYQFSSHDIIMLTASFLTATGLYHTVKMSFQVK